MSKLGTEEAEQIIRQYSDMIYRIAVHNLSNIADAEDILQDVCISLLTKCPKQRDSEHLKGNPTAAKGLPQYYLPLLL